MTAAPIGAEQLLATPRQRAAHLSKLVRLRCQLTFELAYVRCRAAWSSTGLERDEWCREARELTWQLIDLDDEIRQLRYH